MAPLGRREGLALCTFRRALALFSVLVAEALQVPPVANRVPHTVSFGTAGSEDHATLEDDLFWLRDDTRSSDQVLTLLQRLNEEHGKTILMVTHDAAAAQRARRVVHLDKGRLGRVVDNEPAAV